MMPIRLHMLILVVVASLGGLGLAIGLSYAHTDLSEQIEEHGDDNIAMRDIKYLDEGLQRLILITDIVLGSGETYLAADAVEAAKDLKHISRNVQMSMLVDDVIDRLQEIDQFLDDTIWRVEQAATLSDEDRDAVLFAFLEEQDVQAMGAIEHLGHVREQMNTGSEQALARLNDQRRTLNTISIAACGSYIVLVAGLWWFTLHTIQRPIATLTIRADHALKAGEALALTPRGPVEVCQLTQAITALTGNLESRIRDRTAELEDVNANLIDERDRAEALSRAKMDFLANMSHEIRTPMTAIVGFADLLASNDVEEAQRREYTGTIHRNGHHLLGIIDDILSLTKMDAGHLEIETGPCDAQALIHDAVQALSHEASSKGIDLSLSMADSFPAHVSIDAMRVRQVLLNLIGNAVKFTECGQVDVEASWTNDELTVRIADTGIGMSPEQAAKVFEPFTQADETMSRRFGGTGLGLAISHRLALQMGGDITLRTELSQGSCFTFSTQAPAHEVVATENDAASNEPDPADETPPLEGLRILYVEDGVDNQRLVQFLLKKAGATVSLAENGKLGLEEALAAREPGGTPFDLILMDMQMPVMDGYEATRKLREASYDGPIVALTAHAMESDRQRCLDAGCDEYMTKPVKKLLLMQMVQSFTGLKRAS